VANASGDQSQRDEVPLVTLLRALLVIVLLSRLLSMLIYPITDTTEARYSEISRLMLESGDWIMPQFQAGVPFWGKPPLFAWLTAGSFKLLGVGELAARLPHFLLGLASLWLVLCLGRAQLSQQRVALALVILASTPLFFASAGTVMTESSLLFSTTLSMTGFWLFQRDHNRWWGLAFFAGLGLGMLAKGPVAVVLTALPLAFWALTTKRLGSLRSLPWIGGTVLASVISMPWYIAAEIHSPGFLEYFIVGEHILRFIQPGWSGDLYGKAHQEVPGMIWLLWFQATAAWGVLMAFVAGRWCFTQLRAKSRSWPGLSPWQSYLAWWMLAPLLFFTFSGNILWTYVISGMPAFALLLATSVQGSGAPAREPVS
jgi:4-amino-4-deoxy-L-arabinose transferase-like glycosyltransferase